MKECFVSIFGEHYPIELIEFLGKLLAKLEMNDITLMCCAFSVDDIRYRLFRGDVTYGIECFSNSGLRPIISERLTCYDPNIWQGYAYYAYLLDSGVVITTEQDNSKPCLTSRRLMSNVIKVKFHSDYILMINKRNELYIYSCKPDKTISGSEPFKIRDDAIDTFCCENFFGFVTSDGNVYTALQQDYSKIEYNNISPKKINLVDIVSVTSGGCNFFALDKNNKMYYWGYLTPKILCDWHSVTPNVVKIAAGRNCMMYMNSRLEIYVCENCFFGKFEKVKT